MILGALHLASCLLLAGAALYRQVTHQSAAGAHKFIFAFVIAAIVTAAFIILAGSSDLFDLYFGKTYHVMHADGSGRQVDARWLNLTEFFLLILPGFGLFPPVGKRPWLIATLALLSAGSLIFSPLMFF
ncbi:MAG: hypothetical protein EOP85_14340 [Verrucomicrobiaceae bacterium]|nr:MAG: hypothetical protein EOP85_14340 [Verrucomicrobiaceae bacterium]